MFPIIINKNKDIIYGKISTALFPELDFTASPTKKNNFSNKICSFVGIKVLFEVPTQKITEIARTTSNINIEELVIDISNPKILIGRSVLTSNDDIGLIKTDNLLYSSLKIPYIYILSQN